MQPYIVLVGLDLSEPGGRAWRFAFDLADMRGEAEIHAVVTAAHGLAEPPDDVHPPSSVSTSTDEPSPLRLPKLRVLEHRSAGKPARLMAMHFRAGRPDRAIIQLAEEIGADLIVIAAQPISRLQRLLGGSVADKVARAAPCPVVIVRPKADALRAA